MPANAGLEIGGKPISVSQPGTAQGKLRRWTGAGLGEAGSIQHQVNRLFRTEQEGKRPQPHVMSLGDITKGLGLEDTDREMIERVIAETRADYGMNEKTRYPRFAFALSHLSEVLQKTKRISPEARMEVRRRASTYWRKYGKTTYEGKPMIRHLVTKAQLESSTLIKAGDGGLDPKLMQTGKTGKGKKLDPKLMQTGKTSSGGGGGPFIGPRGGKWADAAHTQPYKMSEYKLSVSGKDAQKTGEAIKAGIEKSADICKVSPPVCKGNLGIPRKDMPQLPDDVISSFLSDFQKRGVKVTKQSQHVGQLKATQGEINADKAQGMLAAYKEGSYDPSKKPIIVSKDGYVLDGHHRWAAMLMAGPDHTMRTYQVDTDIRTLLKAADGFKGVKKEGFGEASSMGDAEDQKDVKEATKAIRMEALAAAKRDSYLRSRSA